MFLRRAYLDIVGGLPSVEEYQRFMANQSPKKREELVDELLGQQQVVVKNLESNYRKVDDVSGATIMGDGRVALILDVGSLVRRARH